MKDLEPKIIKVETGSQFIDDLKMVYMRQFPVHERVSLDPFFEPSIKGADAWIMTEGNDVLGFVTVLNLSDVTYIFYLATDIRHQGKGVGSQLVNFVKKQYQPALLFLDCEVPLEEEPDKLQVRLKRTNFYKRLGFKKVGRSNIWRGEHFQTMAIGSWMEEKATKLWEHFGPLWKNED